MARYVLLHLHYVVHPISDHAEVSHKFWLSCTKHLSHTLSRKDPWQTKFNALCQDICNIKANKYVSIRRTHDKYRYTTNSASNKDKRPPMDIHVRGDQDGIYYKNSGLELPPLNSLDTPAHYGSTLCYASQVPLRMLESPPRSPSDPPSPGSLGSPTSSTLKSGMVDNAVLNEWPEASTSSIATALPDLEIGVMGETSSLQWVKDEDKDSREGGEDPGLPEGTYLGPSNPTELEGTLPLPPPASHSMTVPTKLLAKY